MTKPTQSLLWFAVAADGVVPKCNAKSVDRYSFSTGSWWDTPMQAER